MPEHLREGTLPKMKIAMAQVLSTANPMHNLAIIRDYAKQAAAQDAKLVVFPEAMQISFGHSLTKIAEPLGGPWATLVKQLARDIGINIVAGMFTPGTAGHVRNTLLVTGPDADTHYDKIHLYDAFGFSESDTVTPGERPVQFVIDEVTFGLATCYDIRFPQLFTHHARQERWSTSSPLPGAPEHAKPSSGPRWPKHALWTRPPSCSQWIKQTH